MIPRYSRPEMAQIWAPENKYRIWFEIEAHACDAQADVGAIPAAAAAAVRTRGRWEVERIAAIEREVKHDVIAFLTNLAEHVGPEARFVHQGMTSSDVLDTCLAVQLTQAADVLVADLDALLAVLERRAREHKDTLCIGRSHGIHAEPTTFGLKLAGHHAEFARGRARLASARAEVATCAISGAVGTYATVDPRVELHVAAKLGLTPEPVSTQVIPRDRHAMFFATLAVIAGAVERLATEVPPPAAHRGTRGGGILRGRAEGLQRHAAQAQPDPGREPGPAWRASYAAHSARRWRTSRCGTSATSPIPRSSA